VPPADGDNAPAGQQTLFVNGTIAR
jgi:hypothetical protein